MTSTNARHDLRLAASAVGVSVTAMAALAAGREQIAYPVLGGAVLLLAAAGLAATRRSGQDVVVVAPVADIRDISPGHRGGIRAEGPQIEAA